MSPIGYLPYQWAVPFRPLFLQLYSTGNVQRVNFDCSASDAGRTETCRLKARSDPNWTWEQGIDGARAASRWNVGDLECRKQLANKRPPGFREQAKGDVSEHTQTQPWMAAASNRAGILRIISSLWTTFLSPLLFEDSKTT